MNTPNNFNPLAKVFYRPIDAAIRWCNLMAHEAQILKLAWDSPTLLSTAFPQWPCLYANIEVIFDAIRNHELSHGILGIAAPSGTPIDFRLTTVRHIDLKVWMSRYYPDQRPAFLFGKPPAEDAQISIGTYLALQADREALELQLKTTESTLQELLEELKAVGLERANLSNLIKTQEQLSDRSEAGYQRIVGALLETLLGSSPSGKPNSVFNSQASIVDSITSHYGGISGLSKRSLDEKFAAARRALSNT